MFNSIQKLNYQPPETNRNYIASFEGGVCRVESDTGETLFANVSFNDDAIKFQTDSSEAHKKPNIMLFVGLEYLFSHFPVYKKMIVHHSARDTDEIIFTREDFYQLPHIFHRKSFYRRYFPSIQKTISFRTIEIEKDLDRFHEWHNQPRVSYFWELNRSREELHNYLEKGLKDPHQIPMILEMNGEPAGYFEIYWAADDRIAPYYDCAPHDRGFHFLIGEKKFLGIENTTQVFQAVLHFLYLDDTRTKRIVAEPRSDNERFLKYTQIVPSWKFIKEFDFPHKRAALVMSHREQFFKEVVL